jgi:hypothetical protein
MKGFLVLSLFFIASLNAQQKWSWVELDTLPIALSNNAVASAKVGDTT